MDKVKIKELSRGRAFQVEGTTYGKNKGIIVQHVWEFAYLVCFFLNGGENLSPYFFLFNSFILFIYFWLHWVFVAMHGLSLVAASRDYSSLWCPGFSLQWLLLLQSTGSRRAGFSSCGTRLSSCGSQALERRLSSCGAQA